LCTRVLTAANSSAIRRGKPMRSIENCLMALGTRLVRSIATCLSVQSLFDERTATRTEVDLSAFWTHSLLVAELSRSLAAQRLSPSRTKPTWPVCCMTSANSFCSRHSANPTLQLLVACPSEASLSAMESELLGVHHGEIGTWLADQWHLDSSFADGILFHHLPASRSSPRPQLPQVVWLAHAGRL
jgi:HD-like signal output (HDOD) protein